MASSGDKLNLSSAVLGQCGCTRTRLDLQRCPRDLLETCRPDGSRACSPFSARSLGAYARSRPRSKAAGVGRDVQRLSSYARAFMGLTYVTVQLRPLAGSKSGLEESFLVDTGAIDGTTVELPYGFARVTFMGSETVSKVAFGPSDAKSILGVAALESTGIGVDPVTKTLKRMAAKPLKDWAVIDGPGLRRLDAARVAHAEIMRQLEERKRQGGCSAACAFSHAESR